MNKSNFQLGRKLYNHLYYLGIYFQFQIHGNKKMNLTHLLIFQAETFCACLLALTSMCAHKKKLMILFCPNHFSFFTYPLPCLLNPNIKVCFNLQFVIFYFQLLPFVWFYVLFFLTNEVYLHVPFPCPIIFCHGVRFNYVLVLYAWFGHDVPPCTCLLQSDL